MSLCVYAHKYFHKKRVADFRKKRVFSQEYHKNCLLLTGTEKANIYCVLNMLCLVLFIYILNTRLVDLAIDGQEIWFHQSCGISYHLYAIMCIETAGYFHLLFSDSLT